MSDQPSAASDVLARLINAAGRREAPPSHAYERALEAATEVWRAQVRRRRWRIAAALAASIAVVAVGLGLVLRSLDAPTAPAQTAAEVSRVIGDVRMRTDAGAWRSLREDAQSLPTGSVVRVEKASAAALHMGASSVRIAGHAEVVLESPGRLRLRRGKVYVDTGGDAAGAMLIVTGAISVSDIGTQFEVIERDGDVRVRVREGAVLLERDGVRRRGAAGDEISIDRTGVVRHGAIAPNDREWRWVEALATAPDIDNQPLTVLLAWVARETGAPLRYATPAVERKATATILHGSIRNLEPLVALSVMLATTDLSHEVLPDGTIMIK